MVDAPPTPSEREIAEILAAKAEIKRVRAHGGAILNLSGEAYNALIRLPDSIAQGALTKRLECHSALSRNRPLEVPCKSANAFLKLDAKLLDLKNG
jgi:hypothetical protein